MGRAAENGARPVIHQDEVRDVDRQLPARIERVAHGDARVKATLFGFLQLLFGGAHAAALGVERGDLVIVALKLPGQRMVGRNADEGRAKQRVGPGRIDLDPVEALGRVHRRERELQPSRPADPVGLHGLHLGGPVVERIERVEQLFGIIRDAEEPLRQLAPLHQGARPPAAPVLHLLVGEHGHVDGVPVHHRVLAVDETLLEEIEEERLLLAVIFGIAGREHPAPVEREAERLHLLHHRVDVVVGPGLGMPTRRHRGVLGRHAERVKPHRVQHVMPGRPLVARHHVAHRVVADMADMNTPGRIGEHLEHVVFRLVAGAAGFEAAGLVPGILPFRLDLGGGVARHAGVLSGIGSCFRLGVIGRTARGVQPKGGASGAQWAGNRSHPE